MGNFTTISATNCCTAPDRFTNAGTVNAHGDAATTNLAFSNSGTVNLADATFSIGTLSYQQTTGTTKLAGALLAAKKQIEIAGDTLSELGTIT
jgi:hypothetical protein